VQELCARWAGRPAAEARFVRRRPCEVVPVRNPLLLVAVAGLASPPTMGAQTAARSARPAPIVYRTAIGAALSGRLERRPSAGERRTLVLNVSPAIQVSDSLIRLDVSAWADTLILFRDRSDYAHARISSAELSQIDSVVDVRLNPDQDTRVASAWRGYDVAVERCRGSRWLKCHDGVFVSVRRSGRGFVANKSVAVWME
jgi:hypothetical protein